LPIQQTPPPAAPVAVGVPIPTTSGLFVIIPSPRVAQIPVPVINQGYQNDSADSFESDSTYATPQPFRPASPFPAPPITVVSQLPTATITTTTNAQLVLTPPQTPPNPAPVTTIEAPIYDVPTSRAFRRLKREGIDAAK